MEQAGPLARLMKGSLLLLVLALACQATPILPVTNTTSCTVDGTSVPCTTTANGVSFVTFNLFNGSGLDQDTGINISADANARVSPTADFAGASSSTSASLAFNLSLYTDGPVRPGLITYFEVAAEEGEGGGGGAAFVMIEGIGSCLSATTGVPCLLQGDLAAFQLGTVFQIILSAGAGASGPLGRGAGHAGVTLRLFDVNGDPVTVKAVPEPATWIMILIGGGLLCRFRMKGQKATSCRF